MFKRFTGILVCMVLVVAVMAPLAQSQEKTTRFGIKGGFLTSGEITVDELGSADTDASYSVGGFVDYQVAPKLLGTISLDMHSLKAEGESETLMDFSAGFKVLIQSEGSNVSFRPGVSLGFGRIGDIGEFIESSQYLLIKAGLEVVFASQSNMSWLGDITMLSAPTGGNADFEASYGPSFLIRGGILF